MFILQKKLDYRNLIVQCFHNRVPRARLFWFLGIPSELPRTLLEMLHSYTCVREEIASVFEMSNDTAEPLQSYVTCSWVVTKCHL